MLDRHFAFVVLINPLIHPMRPSSCTRGNRYQRASTGWGLHPTPGMTESTFFTVSWAFASVKKRRKWPGRHLIYFCLPRTWLLIWWHNETKATPCSHYQWKCPFPIPFWHGGAGLYLVQLWGPADFKCPVNVDQGKDLTRANLRIGCNSAKFYITMLQTFFYLNIYIF